MLNVTHTQKTIQQQQCLVERCRKNCHVQMNYQKFTVNTITARVTFIYAGSQLNGLAQYNT
jgi:hypothetical protein